MLWSLWELEEFKYFSQIDEALKPYADDYMEVLTYLINLKNAAT